jgi:hypothetical protein
MLVSTLGPTLPDQDSAKPFTGLLYCIRKCGGIGSRSMLQKMPDSPLRFWLASASSREQYRRHVCGVGSLQSSLG